MTLKYVLLRCDVLADGTSADGAGINTAVLLCFAGMILIRKINPTSPVTWGMWMILDTLLTGASYFVASSELQWILPAAWTLGALVVTIACVIRGELSWGSRETLCAVLAGVAAYFWLTINAEAGVVACTLFIVSAYGSFVGVFLPAVSFAYNAILVVFLFRRK